MEREQIVIISLSAIILALLVGYVYVSAELGVMVYEYAKDRKELSVIKKDNQLLRQKILHYSSYNYIATVAASQGFLRATHYYLPTPLPQQPIKKPVEKPQRSTWSKILKYILTPHHLTPFIQPVSIINR